jgi:hypothetical protein
MPMQYKNKNNKSTQVDDWNFSPAMLERTLKTILKKVKLNRIYDIPYLAGYSKDRKTIFIDRHMPKFFIFKGRKIFTDRFLILHECVEKALIDSLKLHYQFAHQIALRVEKAAVETEKISWFQYNRFMQKYIKEIGDEKLERVPSKLDIRPYLDEKDTKVLQSLKRAMVK